MTQIQTQKNGHAATAPARRVTIASITKAPRKRPLRVLVHGQPGVGKTTFAADAPSPVFICPEDGIPGSLDVARFPSPDGGWRWQDILDAITELAIGQHNFSTVVFDTLDWIEPIIWEHVCKEDGVSSIEKVGGGYGKGYQAALDCWRLLLSYLERLSASKGMNVVMLAHSAIRNFKDPQSEGYDRWEMKLHKYPAGLIKEWSDDVLFAQHEAGVATDSRTKRKRGVSTGARIARTVWDAAFDAKNRNALPPEIPLSWAEYAAAIQAGAPAETIALVEEIKRKAAELGGDIEKQALAAIERANGDALKLSKLNDWANAKLALSNNEKGSE
jgi:AAA domain-containing protein